MAYGVNYLTSVIDIKSVHYLFATMMKPSFADRIVSDPELQSSGWQG
jgi:hypothetical protein